MYKCLSGLGWNLSGGLRERVTPSQVHFASVLLPYEKTRFVEAAQPLGEHNGTF